MGCFQSSTSKYYSINQVLLYDRGTLFVYIISEIRLENDNLPAIELFEISRIISLNMSKEKKEIMFCLNIFSLMEQS